MEEEFEHEWEEDRLERARFWALAIALSIACVIVIIYLFVSVLA